MEDGSRSLGPSLLLLLLLVGVLVWKWGEPFDDALFVALHAWTFRRGEKKEQVLRSEFEAWYRTSNSNVISMVRNENCPQVLTKMKPKGGIHFPLL